MMMVLYHGLVNMSTSPHSLQSTVNGSNWQCSECVKVDLEEKRHFDL